MMDGHNPPSKKTARQVLAITLLGLAAGAALLWGAWTVGHTAVGEKTIQDPGPRVDVPTTNLELMLATALQYRAEPEFGRTVTLNWSNLRNFEDNMFNIAYQKGWYAHNSPSWDMKIVLPRSELGNMDEVVENPVTWVNQNRGTQGRARAPVTEFVNVGLDVNPPKSYYWLTIAASFLMMAGIVTIAMTCINAAMHCGEWNNTRRTRRAANPNGP